VLVSAKTINTGQYRDFKHTRTLEQLSRLSDRERERKQAARKEAFLGSKQSCTEICTVPYNIQNSSSQLCGSSYNSVNPYRQDCACIFIVHMDRTHSRPYSPGRLFGSLGRVFWYPCSVVFEVGCGGFLVSFSKE
jgi:hypothetical protein